MIDWFLSLNFDKTDFIRLKQWALEQKPPEWTREDLVFDADDKLEELNKEFNEICRGIKP